MISRHTCYLPIDLFATDGMVDVTGQTFVHVTVTRVGMESTVQVDQAAIEEDLNRVGKRIAVQVGSNGYIVGANPKSMKE